jgi:hypothetical protein
MSFWTDLVNFVFATLVALLTVLHLWAFIWPDGEISKRLHPLPPPSPPPLPNINQIREAVRTEVDRLLEGLRPPPQPDALRGLQLVTTVRRSPRRT